MKTKKTDSHVRLPAHVKPERYRIMIKPDLKGFTFYGEESIFLKLRKQTKEITLHSKDLEIEKAEFRSKKQEIRSKAITYDKKAETVTIAFPKALDRGGGALELAFKGVLNDKMRGFYRSRYEHKGKEKHMATTQFEATDARRAFPCVDEPAAKAVFDVTLMVPKDLIAISNTIETEILEHEGGYKAVKFAPTPKMSTYLLAFIVGEFEYLEGKTKNNTVVRVFVTPGKKHQAEFALDCAIKTMEFYENYFQIPYPLPVMDLIAIPDFSHGAMENWGAVTYRETALLVDPQHTSAANRQWVALVIAHELAHQWFGNLVTMEWWTHLWLNEGFASYIEYLAVDHIFPEWDVWTQFADQDLDTALDLDGLANTHPIEIEVRHPDEIGEIFDDVSYSKGACVIRMLADYLGERDFREGLRHYLKKYSYANASTGHLWQAFAKASGKPVKEIMQNWTQKPGYPLVKVMETKGKLQLLQSRFFSSELSKMQNKDSTLWQTPLLIGTDKLKKPAKKLLAGRELALNKPKGEWVKINMGETGFFRTAYTPELLEKLKKPVRNKELGALDRLGLLRDAFDLAAAGEMPALQALALAENYRKEDNYNVILGLVQGLGAIDNLVREEPYYEDFQKYCRGVFVPLARKAGWKKKKGETHTQGLLRSLVLFEAGHYGDEETIKTAQDLFRQGYVSPDIRSVVYNLVAENSRGKEYKIFLQRYKKEQLQEELGRLGRALASFKNVGLIEQALDFARSPAVRLQNAPGIIVSAWANDHGKEAAWEFMKRNWDWFLENYPSSGHMLNRLIKPASRFTSGEKAEELIRFFKTHPAPGLERTVRQVTERIRSNALWLSREREHIGEWLKNKRN